MTDRRAVLAAGNNADLYEAVFRAQGLRFARLPDGFAALDPPSPFYGHGVVTRPGGAAGLLARLERTFGARTAIKDSFCEIDEARRRVLFEAQWIWRAAEGPESDWRRIDTPALLAAWEGAWGATSPTEQRMFPDTCLTDPGLAFFGRIEAGRVTAGCFVNRSAEVVGLSNVFGDGPETFAEAAASAESFGAGRPIVGYERGADLEAAQKAGFETIGALRVLVPMAV